MLGTSVMVPTLLVPLMGRTDGDKARVIQTLLFVAGINTLLQELFGTRLPAVVGGSYAYVIPILYIIHDSSLQQISEPHVRFIHTMRAIQGALIVAASIQIIMGYSQVWGLFSRFFSPLGMAPVVGLVGFGLFQRGFPAEKKSALHLCPVVARSGDVSSCRYNDKCHFSHDVEAFKAEKPDDLEGECPFLSAEGPSPYGLACRFSGTHKDGFSGEALDGRKKNSEMNGLSKDVQKLLWKNKMKFPKADAQLKLLRMENEDVQKLLWTGWVCVDCNLAILTGYLMSLFHYQQIYSCGWRTLWFAYCHALHAASSQRVMDCNFHPRQCVCALFRHGVGGLAGK